MGVRQYIAILQGECTCSEVYRFREERIHGQRGLTVRCGVRHQVSVDSCKACSSAGGERALECISTTTLKESVIDRYG